jgi:hypothetical protein
MNKVKIEMTYDQIDEIVLRELQETLERNLDEYHNKVKVCEKRKHHRNLIEGIHRTVAYYMEYNAFQAYADTLIWPKKMKRNKYDWV